VEKELFPGKYSANSIRGQYEHSLCTYNWIMAFEKFTGRGGDADLLDEDDPDSNGHVESYKIRLEGAHKESLNIGSLSPKQLNSWYQNGWYTLFHDR